MPDMSGKTCAFADEIKRALLAFFVNSADILADNSQTDQLNAADHENGDDNGCPAGHLGHRMEKFSDDYADCFANAEKRDDSSQAGNPHQG